jgi:malonate transporter and related proteins
MVDILNLALPYFGLIFIGFACGKAKGLPDQGLAWMNFFLLYVSLPRFAVWNHVQDAVCGTQ